MARGGIAASLLKERALRERLFPGLDDPAWMMLLALWEAGEARSTSNACFASYASYSLTVLAFEKLTQFEARLLPESLAA